MLQVDSIAFINPIWTSRVIATWRTAFRGPLVLALHLTASVFSPPPAVAGDDFAPKDSVSSIPPGCHLIEGDILVPDLPVAGAYVTNLWTNRIVPYEFDTNVSPAHRDSALIGMAQWEAIGYGTNVRFVPRTAEPNFIHIQNSTINSSFIGMVGGGQVVNIFNWNFRFIIAHELGHALAFWHEQSRADRNDFVQINYGNICQTCCQNGPCDYNFDIRTSGGEWGPYDFDSVMHYGQCAFIAPGINCPAQGTTITVLPPNQAWQGSIGQHTHLSYLDKTVMSFLYSLPNWRFVDPSNGGSQDGSFFHPYRTFVTAIDDTPTGGTIQVVPGSYAAVGTWSRAVTIRAPLGGVMLQ